MKRHFYSLIILLLSVSGLDLNAQNDSIILINSRVIDPDRYVGINGSPYLYKDFKYGDVWSYEQEVAKSVLLNYNTYSREFEVRKGNQYIELDDRLYSAINIYHQTKDAFDPDSVAQRFTTFSRSGNAKQYFQMLLETEAVAFLKLSDSKITESEIHTLGDGSTSSRKFARYTEYFLFLDGRFIKLKLKKKEVLKALGNNQQVSEFVNNHRYKLKSEEEVLETLKFYSSLF